MIVNLTIWDFTCVMVRMGVVVMELVIAACGGHIITTREAAGTTFGRVGQSLCVCLCVCPVRALTFEGLDLETLFLVWRYIFRIFRPGSYVKVVGSTQGQGHRSKNGICERN